MNNNIVSLRLWGGGGGCGVAVQPITLWKIVPYLFGLFFNKIIWI